MKVLVAVSCAIVAGSWVVAQQPPVFKAGINLVEVDAVVDDGKGHPVRGLAQTDFAIREDGKPVTIESFAELDADGAATAADARFVVLLLDDWTPPNTTVNVQRIAHRFIERMGDRDSLAILRVDGDAVASPMTRDRAPAAIGAFRSLGPGLVTAAARRQHVFETIGAVSHQMAAIAHRRKTLVFVGAPGTLRSRRMRRRRGACRRPPRRPLRRSLFDGPETWFGADVQASHANVSVYVVDPTILRRHPRDHAVYDRSASGFATETGGEIFVGPNVFDRSVDQIWSEAGSLLRHRICGAREVAARHPIESTSRSR